MKRSLLEQELTRISLASSIIKIAAAMSEAACDEKGSDSPETDDDTEMKKSDKKDKKDSKKEDKKEMDPKAKMMDLMAKAGKKE